MKSPSRWFQPWMALALALLPGPARAENWDRMEHLGEAPRGSALLEVETEPTQAVYQLVGTVDPPAVMLNGKAVRLVPYEDVRGDFAGDGAGVFVGEDEIRVEGVTGRFFHALGEAELSRPSVAVMLRDVEGDLLWAVIDLDRTFLDSPLRVKMAVDASAAARAKGIPVALTGKVASGCGILLDHGVGIAERSGVVRLEIPLSLGKSVITGSIRQSDGGTRPIGIPVRVTRLAAREGRAVLSLVPPSGSVLSDAWRLSREGTAIRGVTNPGARIWVDGSETSVDGTGRFEATTYGSPGKSEVLFRVAPPRGPEESFVRRAACFDCAVAAPPPPRGGLGIAAGLGLSAVDFHETGRRDYNMLALTLKAAYQRGLFWRRLRGELSVTAQVQPLLVPGTEGNFRTFFWFETKEAIRLFGLVARVGYIVPGITEPWKLGLFGGAYGLFAVSSGTALQFNQFVAPQVSLVAERKLADGDSAVLYAKGAAQMSGSEVGGGMGWVHLGNDGKPVSFGAEFANLRVDLSQKDVATSRSLGFFGSYRW